MRHALAALAAAGALASCGGGGDEPLKVTAASSLKVALTEYASDGVALAFAGSDQLAAQIRQGARPDVFVAANEKLPADLHAEGLTQPPVRIASNRLVLAVSAGTSAVRSPEDLARDGVRIAVAARGVPAGDYAQRVLDSLPRAGANVRSREPDVSGVVGKLLQRAVDAGFVYATDVRASRGGLREIALPPRLAPDVRYAAVVVRDSPRARAFVDGLRGAPALRAAGFGPP